VAARILPVLVLLAFVLAACGEEHESSPTGAPQGTPTAPAAECDPIGQAGNYTLFLCWRGDSRWPGRFVRQTGSARHALDMPQPTRVGRWAWAKVSPDGKTILAQWSAECEVPVAYLVPAAGGEPREAIRSYASRALGWTKDGLAIVKVLESACGPNAPRPGFYLVDPDGGTTGPLKRRPD
jgi:hypothetical protein